MKGWNNPKMGLLMKRCLACFIPFHKSIPGETSGDRK